MREAKIVVSEIVYGDEQMKGLAQQAFELLILNRYTLSNPINTSRTESVSGGNES